jgi:hypothetical protein
MLTLLQLTAAYRGLGVIASTLSQAPVDIIAGRLQRKVCRGLRVQ